jgi:hypothetical protein
MSFPRKPTPKPTLDAKLIAWARAYHAVCDEMNSNAVMAPSEKGKAFEAERITAATVAAALVAGTDLEGV